MQIPGWAGYNEHDYILDQQERDVMAFKNILFHVQEGVGQLTLNRPQSLNSFTAGDFVPDKTLMTGPSLRKVALRIWVIRWRNTTTPSSATS